MKKESYVYETLGGNNSRAAVQELHTEYEDIPTFRTRLVSVYSKLTDDQALILASKHNKTTAFHHQMSTLERVSYIWTVSVYTRVCVCVCRVRVVCVCVCEYIMCVHVCECVCVCVCVSACIFGGCLATKVLLHVC